MHTDILDSTETLKTPALQSVLKTKYPHSSGYSLAGDNPLRSGYFDPPILPSRTNGVGTTLSEQSQKKFHNLASTPSTWSSIYAATSKDEYKKSEKAAKSKDIGAERKVEGLVEYLQCLRETPMATLILLAAILLLLLSLATVVLIGIILVLVGCIFVEGTCI